MSKKFKIGIDYGGTKIEGILLDDSGAQIERKRYSYEKNYLSGIETVSYTHLTLPTILRV